MNRSQLDPIVLLMHMVRSGVRTLPVVRAVSIGAIDSYGRVGGGGVKIGGYLRTCRRANNTGVNFFYILFHRNIHPLQCFRRDMSHLTTTFPSRASHACGSLARLASSLGFISVVAKSERIEGCVLEKCGLLDAEQPAQSAVQP